MDAINIGGTPAGLEQEFADPAQPWAAFDWLPASGMVQSEAGGPTGAVSEAGAIASGEAFGTPELAVGVQLADVGAIASGEAFGVPTLSLGVQLQDVGAIPSSEAFGSPELELGDDVQDAGEIPSAEAFGTPVLAIGVALLDAGGIPGGEAFGVPSIDGGMEITDAGEVQSAEAFGDPTVSEGASTPSELRYLNLIALRAAHDLQRRTAAISGAGGIESAEAFGEPTVIGELEAVAEPARVIAAPEPYLSEVLARDRRRAEIRRSNDEVLLLAA